MKSLLCLVASTILLSSVHAQCSNCARPTTKGGTSETAASSTGKAITASASPCPYCSKAETCRFCASNLKVVGCPRCGKEAVADSAAEAAPTAEKPVTMTGTLMCAKCTLKETKKCVNAIQVKEGGKTVTYYLEDKGNRETYHADLCGGGSKAGTVTGTVMEKDGMKWIMASKVEFK